MNLSFDHTCILFYLIAFILFHFIDKVLQQSCSLSLVTVIAYDISLFIRSLRFCASSYVCAVSIGQSMCGALGRVRHIHIPTALGQRQYPAWSFRVRAFSFILLRITLKYDTVSSLGVYEGLLHHHAVAILRRADRADQTIEDIRVAIATDGSSNAVSAANAAVGSHAAVTAAAVVALREAAVTRDALRREEAACNALRVDSVQLRRCVEALQQQLTLERGRMVRLHQSLVAATDPRDTDLLESRRLGLEYAQRIASPAVIPPVPPVRQNQ